jgi:uncharacterized protein YgiB involved in biofilm formation
MDDQERKLAEEDQSNNGEHDHQQTSWNAARTQVGKRAPQQDSQPAREQGRENECPKRQGDVGRERAELHEFTSQFQATR